MKLTPDKFEALIALTSKFKRMQNLASEKLKTVQSQFGQHPIKIDRDGKITTVTQMNLWQEVFYGSKEAREILEEKYPDVFLAYDKENELGQELQVFVLKNFGIDYKKMVFSDYIMLMLAVVEYKQRHPEPETNLKIGVELEDEDKMGSEEGEWEEPASA